MKFLLRMIAWLTAAVVLIAIIGVILVLNFNKISPVIVSWIEDRSDNIQSIESLHLTWVDLNPRILINNLAAVHQTTDADLSLTVEHLAVTPVLQSIIDRKLRVKDLTIAGSNLNGWVNVKADRQKSAEANLRDTRKRVFSLLQSVHRMEHVDVTGGSINVQWRAGDSEFSAIADYELGSTPTDDGFSIVGNLKSKLHHNSEIQIVYDVTEHQAETPQYSSVLNLNVSQLDLAWFAPLNLPRVSLSDSRAVLDVELAARFENDALQNVNWGLKVIDPDLSAETPVNEPTVLTATGTWRPDQSDLSNGSVSVRAVLDNVDAVTVLKRHPESFPPKFHKHMSERLQSLAISSVIASYDGAPLEILKNDALSVDGQFSNFSFNYGRRMPPLEEGSGRFQVQGQRFEAIFQNAAVYGSDVQELSSVITDVSVPDPEMILSGLMNVSLPPVIELFGPEGSMQPGRSKVVESGTGNGLLSITSRIPLRRGKEFNLDGTVDLENVTANLQDGTTVNNINGLVKFTRYGITEGILEGRAYDGDITAEFKKSNDPESNVIVGTAAGTVPVENLGNWLGEFGASRINGTAVWGVNYEFGKNVSKIQWQSNLDGVEVDLPAPLDKNREQIWNLILDIDFAEDSQRTLNLAVDSVLDAEFHTIKKDGAWQLTKGAVGIGAAMPELEEKGLVVAIDVPEIDYDSWTRLTDVVDEEDDANLLADVLHAEVRATQVNLSRDRKIDKMALEFMAVKDGWQVAIESNQIEGTMHYARHVEDETYQGPKLNVELSKCHIPEATSDPMPSTVTPASLPMVDFVCEDAVFGTLKLGRAQLLGIPTFNGWAMRNIEFISPVLRITASGNWMAEKDQQSTELEFQFVASDFGRAVEDLGFGKKFIEGVGKFHGELHWPDSVMNWEPAKSSGQYEFDAIDGYIVDIDSTTSKLLLVFSYEKLLDRLRLDFSDIEVDGFKFDEISGSGKINSGEIEIKDLFIDAPTAEITLNGITDWAKREHQIDVHMDPNISGTLPTLVTAAVAPVAGLITYLARDEINDRFKSFTGSNYTVTGPWDEPQVTKVEVAK